jgi:hypothetical protein
MGGFVMPFTMSPALSPTKASPGFSPAGIGRVPPPLPSEFDHSAGL